VKNYKRLETQQRAASSMSEKIGPVAIASRPSRRTVSQAGAPKEIDDVRGLRRPGSSSARSARRASRTKRFQARDVRDGLEAVTFASGSGWVSGLCHAQGTPCALWIQIGDGADRTHTVSGRLKSSSNFIAIRPPHQEAAILVGAGGAGGLRGNCSSAHEACRPVSQGVDVRRWMAPSCAALHRIRLFRRRGGLVAKGPRRDGVLWGGGSPPSR